MCLDMSHLSGGWINWLTNTDFRMDIYIFIECACNKSPLLVLNPGTLELNDQCLKAIDHQDAHNPSFADFVESCDSLWICCWSVWHVAHAVISVYLDENVTLHQGALQAAVETTRLLIYWADVTCESLDTSDHSRSSLPLQHYSITVGLLCLNESRQPWTDWDKETCLWLTWYLWSIRFLSETEGEILLSVFQLLLIASN